MSEGQKLQLEVASPCPASWDEMDGDDGVRFCPECEVKAYNLSAMPEDEAIELVSACARCQGESRSDSEAQDQAGGQQAVYEGGFPLVVTPAKPKNEARSSHPVVVKAVHGMRVAARIMGTIPV